VTERDPQAEAQRLAAIARMEIVGLTATGVVHDLNNLLTALGGAFEGIRAGDTPSTELLDSLAAMLRRVQDVTRRLLEAARPGRGHAEPIDLRTPVRQAADLLRIGLRPGIAVDVDLSHRPIPVLARRVELIQCLFNLGVNARDAMEGRGRLSVRLRAEEAEALCRARGWTGPRCACLVVQDSGPGIPEDIAARIFDPFFTTKAGKGTGMGLATVRAVVEEHDGTIEVESPRGEGARFTIRLPLHAAFVIDDEPTRSITLPAVPAANSKPLTGRTVLVADDEPALRILLDTVLRQRGATVTVVEDGPSAIAAMSERAASGTPFSIAVLDAHLPGVQGVEHAAAAREAGIERIVVTSGLAPDDTEARSLAAVSARFLAKPFAPSDLLDLLMQR
jgi:CheY-like chemotaxis protein